MSSRPDYGIDAPGWLIGSACAGAAALGVGLYFRIAAPDASLAPVLRHAIWPAIVWLGYAAVHLWSSKIGKRRQARKMIDSIPWRGDERVLDVGCGRGLLLIEAAKRLSRGRAVGVDVWNSKDQWDNRPDATLSNAEREGVAERIEVREADARSLPFEDGTFDVVVSSFVIHNIRDKADQARAVREIARVLRPSGRVMILDIEGTRRYVDELRRVGLIDVRRRHTSPLFVPGTATVSARKP
jgi:SAM-dependent methyltransferase